VIKKIHKLAKKITINQQKGRLSQDEINRIVEDAEKYKAEDEEKRKQVQSKNELENLVYQIRNTLDDSKFKNLLKEEDKTKVNEAVKSCLKWIEDHPHADTDEYDNKRKELEEMWRPIITAAYGGSGSGGGGGGMPNMGDFGHSSNDENASSGPKIDEVD